MRNSGGMPLEMTQNAVVALREPEAAEQPLGRTPSRSMGDKPDQLRHPTRLSRVGRRHRGARAGESATAARWIAAAPAGCPQVHLDGSALDGQACSRRR